MKVMSTPRSVDLDITGNCNLRCTYCSHFDSPGDVKGDLPTGEWLRFFEELGRCAVMRVCLSGGEPFVREDLEELIGGIVKNRMRFNILSNGTLITGERAAFLARTGRCDSVQVSLDGATARVHESCRGAGSFARAFKGMQKLKQSGVPLTVRVTIHRHNIEELEQIAQLLLEELALPTFSTNAASHLGLCRENKDAVQLEREHHQRAMETLVRLNRKYNGRIKASSGPLADAKGWKRMEQARRQGLEKIDGGGFLSSCQGVMNKIAVRADGVMVPCAHLSHIELGRIIRDDLREVWQNSPELGRMRTRSEIPLSEFAFCRGCEYMPYCRGGCPALAYTTENDENHPVSQSCLRRFLKEGGRVPASDNGND